MSKQKTIILTGGGSGGHVSPCLSVAQSLKGRGYKLHYIGSFQGVEKDMVATQNIIYSAISTGKLRRYFSIENLIDVFKIIKGVLDAWFVLRRYKREDCLIFSCGGFVTVPVVIAAWAQRKKVIIHEQTSRAGLANRIAARFAHLVLITFESSNQFFPSLKTLHVGYPLRDEIFQELKDLDLPFFNLQKPLFFITGGGNGAKILNNFVKNNIKYLKENFNIYHQVGKKHLSEFKELCDQDYICADVLDSSTMISLLRKSQVVLSRAGAGTVCELIALGKPSILVPLKIAQKNEQFFNAQEAQKKLGSYIIQEDKFTLDQFIKSYSELRKQTLHERQEHNPKDRIVNMICEEVKSEDS